MPDDFGVDADLAAIRSLQGTDTTWFAKVAAVLRKTLHSSVNRFGPAARRDDLTIVQSMPIGGLADYAATDVPDGWLECDGRSLSRATYSALFAVTSTRFGSDSVGTFKLPDFRRRQAVGRQANGLVGVATGAETAVMTEASMPSHGHAASAFDVSEAGAHAHQDGGKFGASAYEGDLQFEIVAGVQYTAAPSAQPQPQSGSGAADYEDDGVTGIVVSKYLTTGHLHNVTGDTESAGSSENISVVSPSITMVKCIYTGVA